MTISDGYKRNPRIFRQFIAGTIFLIAAGGIVSWA